jgi:hypothetical protein
VSQVDHYLPLFGRDFLAATAGWTAAERGHYITLLIVQWEQGGLPAGLDRLELVSPGVSAVWEIVQPKFPECDDGLRRNRRLEEHREKCKELKDARSEAGKRGSDARWGRNGIANRSQADGKPMASGMANGMANGMAKTWPPTPTPTPNREEDNTRAPGGEPPNGVEPGEADGDPAAADAAPVGSRESGVAPRAAAGGAREPADPWRSPGWVHDDWARVAAAWNTTDRAVPWTLVTPPNGFAELAASPGWLASALAGIAMLPDCRRFARPVPWTQFVRDLDRILAGEFRDPPPERRELSGAAAGGAGGAGGRAQRRGNMR